LPIRKGVQDLNGVTDNSETRNNVQGGTNWGGRRRLKSTTVDRKSCFSQRESGEKAEAVVQNEEREALETGGPHKHGGGGVWFTSVERKKKEDRDSWFLGTNHL